ncbi:MAG TPA: ferredoxin--nitrite reductase [Dehalococcoidia bacterium]|nr:ferredoxin--nitrite reductase [Dehalococcoidia bacterium]
MRAVETIVQTNAPGEVLPILAEALDDFETEASRFLAGGYEQEAVFQGYRLKQGVYGQRQANVQMTRVKLPFGGVTPEQMDAFGELTSRFAPLRKGHITTRQNFQFHHIPLSQMPAVLRLLASTGLSTREACGNTVRNVTADPWAGVTTGELFDVTPYAGAFARFWLRNPLTQLLPRKFKVAFSADDTDVGITGIHDLGFIPRIQDGVKGFKMVCGGGLAIMPRQAIVVREFVPLDEYLKVSEAVIRIFNAADMLRKNRAMARIKVLIDRIGPDRFLEMVDDELAQDWAKRDFSPERLLFLDNEEERAPSRRDSYEQPSNNSEAFKQFVTSNVKAQKQQGFSTVEVKITRGDLNPEQFHGIANLMREYCGGNARTTVQQNMVLRWVRDESLYEVYSKLVELDLAEAGASTLTDVVSCPGTDSCKLGITSSMGLNRAIQERVTDMGVVDPLVAKLHIKMSGCPNSCGQHHLGNIGFHGAAMKVEGHQLPAYHAFIGGGYEEGNGKIRVGTQLKLRLPAKRTPDAVQRWLNLYQQGREDGEEFNAYFDRVGKEPFEKAVQDLTIPGEFSDDNREMFIDWTKLELYVLERGEGECAV